MAFPYTLPSAVGGYDSTQAGEEKSWRRPTADSFSWPPPQSLNWLTGKKRSLSRSLEEHREILPSCKVKLFDITRGSPQRIEGQYRRHWSFAPAMWNLLFRANVNLGASLFVKRKAMDQKPSTTSIETDVAMAAANLLELLETGYYVTPQGKRRRINWDFSKLFFAKA